MGKIRRQAEWYLYHYQDIVEKEKRTREAIEDDAYNAAFSTGSGTPVKSSYTGSKTENAASNLIMQQGHELTPTEQMWLYAIKDVWAMYHQENKAMERLMIEAFGLTGKRVHRGNRGYVRDKIMAELYIDRVQTYYAYRQTIINDVIESALAFKAFNKGME